MTRTRTVSIFAVVALVLAVCFFVGNHIVHAVTAEELQAKIDAQNADIAKLEQEIAKYQGQLATLGTQKETLSSNIKELDITTKKLYAQISVTQQKINQKNTQIANLGTQIDDKSSRIGEHKSALSESVRFQQKMDEVPLPYLLVSSDNISDSWQAIDEVTQFNSKIKNRIDVLGNAKADLEDTKKVTEKAKAELESLKRDLSDQKKIVDGTIAQKNKLLKETKNQESGYKLLLADRLAKKDAFEKDLREYESQLQYVLNPSLLPKAGSSPLSWPLDSIRITQQFGRTVDSVRLYASGSHNGTDFAASIGTPVKAMADGVVAGIGDTDAQCNGVSFGKFILIKYNDGLASTFGHLSLIKVTEGQQVSRGDIVGYSGNTGYTTGPHLHVSVYARDAVSVKSLPSKSCVGRMLTQPVSPIAGYLDPMAYLPSQ